MSENATPEEKKWRHPYLDSYQQKLERNSQAFKWFIIAGAVLFIVSRSIFACNEMKSPAPPSVEHQLKDTLIEGHQDVDGTVPLFLKRRDRL